MSNSAVYLVVLLYNYIGFLDHEVVGVATTIERARELGGEPLPENWDLISSTDGHVRLQRVNSEGIGVRIETKPTDTLLENR